MLTTTRRASVALVTATALVLSACASEDGDTSYPDRRVQLLVGFGAGGANDTAARTYAESFNDVTGTNMLVVNRPGAGGIIAATEAMLDAADGYRLFLAPVAAFTSAPLMQNVRYSDEDFRSVGLISAQPYVVVTSANSDIQSLDDLDSLDRDVTYSTFGNGHATQLVTGQILHDRGVSGRPVPFDSAPNALQSLVNNETDLGAIDIATALPRIESGELTALAITGPERSDDLPDVPRVTEAGHPDADFEVAQAIVTPADTPDDVAAEITTITEEVMETQQMQDFLAITNSYVPDMRAEDWMSEYIPAERARYAAGYEELGIEP